MLAYTASDAAWIALAVFLVAVGSQRVGREGFAFQFVVARGLQGEKRVTQALREPDMGLAEYDGGGAGGELDGNAVHAVHACA